MKDETVREKYIHKRLPWLINKAQETFNEYIRLRDKDKPCVSCGRYVSEKDCGHYYSVGEYPGLRFFAMNGNGECRKCNYYSGDHLIGYKKSLIKRYGEENVKWLEDKAALYKRHGKKWDRIEVIEVIINYRKLIKEIKA
jgi:hypothetical protein